MQDITHVFEKEVYATGEDVGRDELLTTFYTSLEDLDESVTEVAVYQLTEIKKLVKPVRPKRFLK